MPSQTGSIDLKSQVIARNDSISVAASDATDKANAAEQNAIDAIPSSLSSFTNDISMAWQGTCTTAAGTAAKVVTCAGFALVAGASVTVRFSNSNTSTATITLNVNSTGAKAIYINGGTTSSTNQLLWAANATISFMYDGAYWRVTSEPRSWFGTCTTAAATAAKTSSISEVVICKGTTISLQMSNANTVANPTLNVTAIGAKAIYTAGARPTNTSINNWTAASTVSFVFDGQYFRYDSDSSAKANAAEKVATNYITHVDDNGITIHPSGGTASRVQVNASGTTIYQNNTDVAFYGASARIGKAGSNRVEIDSTDGITIYKGTKKRLQTTSAGLDLYRDDETSIVSVGSTVRIGLPSQGHSKVSADGFNYLQGDNSVFAVEAYGEQLYAIGTEYGNRVTIPAGGSANVVGSYPSNISEKPIFVYSSSGSLWKKVGTQAGDGIAYSNHASSSGGSVAATVSFTMTVVNNTSSSIIVVLAEVFDRRSVRIRVGKEHVDESNDNQSYMALDYHSLQLIDKEGDSYFHVSDLRDENGFVSYTDTFTGDGTTIAFPITFRVDGYESATYTVTINDVILERVVDYDFGFTAVHGPTITFTNAPSVNAVIVVTYTTPDNDAKSLTIGRRRSGKLGRYSIAVGNNVLSSGYGSYAEGIYTQSLAYASHAEGGGSVASGTRSHAEGRETTASGNYSHAEGGTTIASGDWAHAEGYDSVASGDRSHAEGSNTIASDMYAHAEGNNTIASGYGSHAEGMYTTASGFCSHAQNKGTIAASMYQTAIGQYNIENTTKTYALIIGNGSSDTARSNALTVNWNGDIDAGRYLNFNHRDSGAVSSAIGNPPSEAQYYGAICTYDVDGARNFYCQTSHTTNDNLYQSFVLCRLNGSETITNGFYIGIDASSGDPYVSFTSGGAAAWRSGLGLGSLATKSSLVANDIPNSMAAGKIASTALTTLTLNSATKAYSTGWTPKYRKWGNVVEVSGAISPKNVVAAEGSLTIATLPTGYRPGHTVCVMCQGSGTAQWLLTIETNGEMEATRYRTGTTYAAMQTNSWLAFHVTFIVS